MCNCEENKCYDISMGCCVPVVADANNYYTKSEVDEKIEDIITSGCCITPEEVDEKISSATSGFATEEWVEDKHYLTEHQSLSAYSTTQEVNTLINQSVSGKQDTLISGQNIKTINGQTLLGDGNLVIEGGGGSITVDNMIDSGSTNPVENRVIYNALEDKAAKTDIPTVPTSNTAFTNDAGYLTEHQSIKTINGNVLVGVGNVQLDIPKIWYGTKVEYEYIQNKDEETIYLVYEN